MNQILSTTRVLAGFFALHTGISTMDEFRAINVMLMNDYTEYMKHMIETLV